jgi:hypothetical protein
MSSEGESLVAISGQHVAPQERPHQNGIGPHGEYTGQIIAYDDGRLNFRQRRPKPAHPVE